MVSVSVADEGFGVPDEIRETLFMRVARCPRARWWDGPRTIYRAAHRRGARRQSPLRAERSPRERLHAGAAAHCSLDAGGAVIRVGIVEDHALTRSGIKTALASQADVEVVAEAGDGNSGLIEIVRTTPDVAVVDIGLPGIDGIELTRRLRAQTTNVRIVILTMHDLDREILAALAAGADAYVVKGLRCVESIDGGTCGRGGWRVLRSAASRMSCCATSAHRRRRRRRSIVRLRRASSKSCVSLPTASATRKSVSVCTSVSAPSKDTFATYSRS